MPISTRLHTAGVFALFATTLQAQSQTLTTTFAGGTGLAAGATTFFDLAPTLGPVTITSLDIHSMSAAGTTGTIDIYAFPVTAFGNEGLGAPPWSVVGSGTATSAGFGVATPVTLAAPFVITAPTGIAICYNGLAVAYSRGPGSTPTELFTGAGLTLTAGTASPTCLNAGAIFRPRTANVTLRYDLLPGTATEIKYGTGCGSTATNGDLTLCSTARPIVGTTVQLVTTEISPSLLIGATLFSFGQVLPGTATPFAGCELYVAPGASIPFIPAGANTFSQPLPIPSDPSLSGRAVYCQSAGLTSTGPLAGATSNGVALVVGTL